MRTVTRLVIASLISVSSVHGENLIGVSAAAGPAFPVRAVKRLLGTGYEGTAAIDLPLNGNISIVARWGYYRWEFSNGRINTWAAASGAGNVTGAAGPFQAIPLTVGARVMFDGALLRPYFGLSGGACFLHWKFSGTSPVTGLPGGVSSTWTEPAMSIEAGLNVTLTGGLSLDLGGTYTACANPDDRIEPAEFLGVKIADFNTATFAGVQAGLRVAF